MRNQIACACSRCERGIKSETCDRPAIFFCLSTRVYFLVHVFDRVSSGRGQKAESGESHYQKRRAQIANWRRLSGARVCARCRGRQKWQWRICGVASDTFIASICFSLLRWRVNHIQIATFASAAIYHRVTPIKCRINYAARAPLADCVLKNNYTVNKLWGAIHSITAFFYGRARARVLSWLSGWGECHVSFHSSWTRVALCSGDAPAIYDRCTLVKRNPPILVECRDTICSLFEEEFINLAHKCILNARWIK